MTELEARKMFVDKATEYYGTKEDTSAHHYIIDKYNEIAPLPRGYMMKYTDAWCAAFVSMVAHQVGLDAIFPYECSCYYMAVGLLQTNQWVEDDSYMPETGDLVFYNWSDVGEGDCIGAPNHVGIVVTVSEQSGTFNVIEGNNDNQVKYRAVKRNQRYLRGFGVLDWSKITMSHEQQWCVKNGLYLGYGNGSFGWEDNLTLDQMANLLYRFYLMMKREIDAT